MGKVICIANQKGGVGKTNTCVNLGIALAMAGKRVCLIDSDPQGSLTESLGWRKWNLTTNCREVTMMRNRFATNCRELSKKRYCTMKKA